jgi:hypothetical protein
MEITHKNFKYKIGNERLKFVMHFLQPCDPPALFPKICITGNTSRNIQSYQ